MAKKISALTKTKKSFQETYIMMRISRLIQINAFLILALFGASALAQSKNPFTADSGEGNSGVTSLMSAVINSDVEGVKFFIKTDPSSLNAKNIGGASALVIAARENNFEISKILIDAGADVNSSDNDGWTPLMRASLASNPNIIKHLLLKGANAGQVNKFGELAIFHASSSDCNQCLSTLLENYDFVKNVNPEVLKSNLKDSYELAMNHNNNDGQMILSSYSDYAQKQWSEHDSQKQLNEQKIEMNAGNNAQEVDGNGVKKFKFSPGENVKKPSNKSSSSKPDLKKTEQKFTENDISSSPAESSVPPYAKFRFNVGEPGKIIDKKSPKKLSLMPKAELQKEEVVEEKIAPEVEQKADQQELQIIEQKPVINNSLSKFKLIVGPEGKKINLPKPKKSSSKSAVVSEVIGEKSSDLKIEKNPIEAKSGDNSQIIVEPKNSDQLQK